MKIKRKKLGKCFFLVAVCLLLGAMPVMAADTLPYPTYTINADWTEAPSPAVYVPYKDVYASDVGLEAWEQAVDMEVYGSEIFILEAKQGIVVVLDDRFQLVRTIGPVVIDGEESPMNAPQGLTISPDGELYIADSGNARILRLTREGEVLAVYNKPVIEVLGDDYTYKPLKIGVDSAKRIYVIAEGINRGLLELNASGEFSSFLGAPRVTYDMFTLIWKRLMTREMAKNMVQFVPTEFSNLRIDSEGFIFTTIKAFDQDKLNDALNWTRDFSNVKLVQKFNASSTDVLRRYGDIPIIGDVNVAQSLPSYLEDIYLDESGGYYCLDSNRSRVFYYDTDGNLLYAFGIAGRQQGTASSAAAIDMVGENLLVLDKAVGKMIVYSPTAYGRILHNGAELYADGQYEASLEAWQEVVKYNGNLSLAYIGMGKCAYYLEDYPSALHYLELANEKTFWSKAFNKNRQQFLSDNFVPVAAGVAAVVVIIIVLNVVLKRRKKKGGGES